MPINLTDATINSLKYEQATKVHWDKNLPSFGIRVGKNTKTFIVCKGQKRIHFALGVGTGANV